MAISTPLERSNTQQSRTSDESSHGARAHAPQQHLQHQHYQQQQQQQQHQHHQPQQQNDGYGNAYAAAAGPYADIFGRPLVAFQPFGMSQYGLGFGSQGYVSPHLAAAAAVVNANARHLQQHQVCVL